MTIDIGIDPSIFAFIANLPREELLRRIRTLTEWSKFRAANKWLSLNLPPTTERDLRRQAFLPAHEPVKEALEETQLRYVFSPEDVIRVVHDLLQTCVSTCHCCVVDELHEEFDSDPPQPWQSPVVDALTESALLLGEIERSIHGDTRLANMVSFQTANALSFGAEIHAVDPHNVPGLTGADLPKQIDGEVRIINTSEQLLSIISPEQIWTKASHGADLKLAILLKCREKLALTGKYEGLEKIPVFYVGSDFYSSLVTREASGSGKFASQTLDSCAAAVLDLPSIEFKEFRKNNRKADSASPLRAHISKGGPALRLMAWRRPGAGLTPSSLEFANVGRKNEEEIVYSDPQKAV